MKSKISCWRLVRSMEGPLLRAGMSGLGEHVFDKVARPADGYKTPLSLSSVRPRAGGGIGRRARLRALWAVWPVEVRVLFGAFEKPVFIGVFGPSSLSLESAAGP